MKMTSKEIKFGYVVSKNVFIVKKLDELQLNKKYLGYYMLIEILNILINEEQHRIESFSQLIYPRVAILFNKTSCTVERNIRNLIDKCWSPYLMEKLNFYLPEGCKPTCRDFVYMVKNYIMKQII